MKLDIKTDFTKFPRATSLMRAGEAGTIAPYDTVVLDHDERHLRRKVVELVRGDRVLVDLPEPVRLGAGDLLVLDDGRHVKVAAADEELYDIRASNPVHLAELAWHIGNRHLAAGIEADRILIRRDHVIKAMLEGLGATVTDVLEPFEPVRGAYSGHGQTHGESHSHSHAASASHSHGHSHHDDHHHGEHGERDGHGRLPGDPHYGHNHA